MADAFEQIRNFLYDMARRRRREGLWNDELEQPSPSALAARTGIPLSTIDRMLQGRRNTLPDHRRSKPLRRYRMTAEIEEKLLVAFGFKDALDLQDELRHSPSAPPWKPMRRRRVASEARRRN